MLCSMTHLQLECIILLSILESLLAITQNYFALIINYSINLGARQDYILVFHDVINSLARIRQHFSCPISRLKIGFCRCVRCLIVLTISDERWEMMRCLIVLTISDERWEMRDDALSNCFLQYQRWEMNTVVENTNKCTK